MDYDVGLIDRPSTVTVNFISENGTYLEPELSVTKPYLIEIGNLVSENYYAVTRTFAKSSGGRTLEVTFKDGSIILDRIWVGLQKQMGDSKTNEDGLIIVGREVHPCDVNEDGVFDQKDVDLLKWRGQDPCELRCPTEHPQAEPIAQDCIKKEITDIFEVKYTFDDLIDAMLGSAGSSNALFNKPRQVSYPVLEDMSPNFKNVSAILPATEINTTNNASNKIKIASRPKTVNTTYFAAYSGTLRDVLRSWCGDFGWSFYWEDDALNFIDTTERPNVSNQDFSNLESLTDTKTLEGTVARGFVSHYAQAGVEAQKDCQQSRAVLLRCLNLKDLFGDAYKPSWNAAVLTQNDYSSVGDILSPPTPDAGDGSADNQIEYRDDVHPDGVPINNFEASVVCSYYSDALRHLYNLWEYYGIRSADDAISAKGKWLDRLGQMKIVNVFSSKSSGAALETFNRITGNDVKDETGQTMFSPDDIEHIRKYNGYVVAVLRNTVGQKEDLLDKQFRIEERLASDFMGAHWYRAYVAPFLGETPQIFPNGQYFGALSTNVKDVPFACFNHTYKSNVGKMVSSFCQRQQNDYRQYGALKFSQDFSKNTSKKLVRSLLYFNHPTNENWMPLKNSETQLSSLLKDFDNYIFKVRELDRFSKETIASLVTENGVSLVEPKFYGNLQVLVFYPVPPTGFKFTDKIVDNPNKEYPQHTESLEPFALATAGLLSNSCAQYAINGTPIFTPAGASVLLGGQNDRFKWDTIQPTERDFQAPAYKVYVTNSIPNRGIVPKTEFSFVEPADVSECLKVEYQTKEISKDSLQYLNKLSTQCQIPIELLLEVHTKLAKNLNFSVNKPFNTKTYRIMGLKAPSKIAIKDGLTSLKVRVGNEGVFTDIEIGDTLFTPPAPDYITRTIEQTVGSRLANVKRNPL